MKGNQFNIAIFNIQCISVSTRNFVNVYFAFTKFRRVDDVRRNTYKLQKNNIIKIGRE